MGLQTDMGTYFPAENKYQQVLETLANLILRELLQACAWSSHLYNGNAQYHIQYFFLNRTWNGQKNMG